MRGCGVPTICGHHLRGGLDANEKICDNYSYLYRYRHRYEADVENALFERFIDDSGSYVMGLVLDISVCAIDYGENYGNVAKYPLVVTI